jgi:hypothetical protein
VLARSGSRDRHVLVLGIHMATGALVECMLTPPLPRREAEQLQLYAESKDSPAGRRPNTVGTDEYSCLMEDETLSRHETDIGKLAEGLDNDVESLKQPPNPSGT